MKRIILSILWLSLFVVGEYISILPYALTDIYGMSIQGNNRGKNLIKVVVE